MDFASIKDVVKQTIKRNYKQLIAMSFGLFAIILLCLAVNLFATSSLLVSMPFVILPFFISTVICNMKLKNGGEFENKDFYRNYRVGIMYSVRGFFRIIRSYIESFIGFFIVIICVYFIPSRIGLFNTSTFESLVSNYVTSGTQDSLTALNAYVNSNDTAIVMVYITYLAAYGVGLMIFIAKMIKNLFIFYISSQFGTDKKESIAIYNRVFPKIRKTYLKININFLWSFFVAFPIGYITGISIVSIWSHALNIMLFGGCLGGLLFCVPLLPLVITSQDVMFSIFSPYFLVEARDAILEALKAINNSNQIPDQQKDFLRQYYVAQLKQIDDIKSALAAENGEVYTPEFKETTIDQPEEHNDDNPPREENDSSLNEKNSSDNENNDKNDEE